MRKKFIIKNKQFSKKKKKHAKKKIEEDYLRLVAIIEEKEALNKKGQLYNNSIYGSLSYGLMVASGTFFYERMLKQNMLGSKISSLAKIGIGAIAFFEDGSPYVLGQFGILTGDKNKHFEASIGMIYFYKGWFEGKFKNNPIYLFSGSMGYRYQKPDGHFIFRTGVGWPEVILYTSFGISF